MIGNLLVLIKLITALGNLISGADSKIRKRLNWQLRELVAENLRSRPPFLKSSLQIGFDMMHLILAESELVADHLSDLYVLLPSLYVVGEPFLFSVTDSPPNDVLLH